MVQYIPVRKVVTGMLKKRSNSTRVDYNIFKTVSHLI
jgi:hypothetical protein